MPPGAIAKIHSVDVLVGVQQREIDLEGKPYYTLPFTRSLEFGGGIGVIGGCPSNSRCYRGGNDIYIILGGMVIGMTAGFVYGTGEMAYEGYRQTMAGHSLAPVQDTLREFDFGETLRNAMVAQNTAWWNVANAANTAQVEVLDRATPEHFESRYSESQKDAVLIMTCRYSISPDLLTVTVSGEAALYPNTTDLWQLQYDLFRRGSRTDKLQGKQTSAENSLYRSLLIHKTSLPASVDDRDAAANMWAEHNGQRLRDALAESARAFAKQVAGELGGWSN